MNCKVPRYLMGGLAIALALTGCGGGSSTPTPTPVPPPTSPTLPTLSISDASAIEGNSGSATMSFTVTLSASSQSSVTAQWTTSNGTATAGTDYQSASGTVRIAAGQTSTTATVTVTSDTDAEPDETFNVVLSNPSNATIADSSAIGTITNDDATAVFGLDSRLDNQTCVAPARPNLPSGINTVDAFPNLPTINQPTKMLLEPGSNPRWFVLQKGGQLVVFDPDNATAVTPYVNVSVRTDVEGGLLDMAFHPNYPSTPEIFLSYTINHTGPAMRSVVSRVILDNVAAPSAIGSGSVEQRILLVDQDFDNHNGGDIAFGPDGNLYIGFGDGGDGGDPLNSGQDTTRLLGSFLRIDVTGSSVSFPANPYAIPSDNPFAGQPKCGPGTNANNCPEIYAWGMRNPWRWSFDAPTNTLWAADVGQDAFEEVDIIERGKNYGWRCREGAHDFNTANCAGTYEDPVAEYGRSEGNSITGGFVYRGSAVPGLIGAYIFADYGSGRIWSLAADGQGGYTRTLLEDTSRGPSSFGVDQAGEHYFTDINSGRLIKLVPDGSAGSNTIPDLLSNSGCVNPTNITQPYSGLLPYDINAPFWSDGAAKERFIGLPNSSSIAIDGSNDWTFPQGTVIVKNFRLNGNLIETRHLMRHPDGVWAGYTYEWNAAQTEATRVVGGKTVNVAGQDWIFPSAAQCDQCHTSAAKFALGPETAQLNRDFTYSQTGRSDNQLETMDHVMMFSSPLAGAPATLPALADPLDTSKSLDSRARAYLHSNCAQCHQPGGGSPVGIDLRYQTALPQTGACDIAPQAGDLGIANARIIAPGSSATSVLTERMNRRGTGAMPPVGSTIVDNAGVRLVRDWIDSLANCN
ncbi:MAG: PQQ-dependent sugar dehydrogenase [Gammaproteobacteria bacterium]|nr:PQQ-dependent sugar dehydrogenase [Gammaproteobacteria bacterium]